MTITDRLSNGMRVVAEPMEGVRSVAIGIWIPAGPVYEGPDEGGISHMIEHMLFKGTDNRTAKEIAGEMDGLGGNLNAFTAKECTCYYAKVLDEHLGQAVDILQDLVQYPRLAPEDLSREQGVVCEEILMVEDSPEELVHELLGSAIYGESPLARPILGSQESVRAFTPDRLRAYMARRYQLGQMVVACAGRVDMQTLLPLLEAAFCKGEKALPAPGEDMPASQLLQGQRFVAVQKDVEQTHICLGFPGFPTDTKEQFALYVLNNALGGSMSSRLFQHIREERGMAYSVYSYPSGYSGTGYFALYAGTEGKQGAKVAELMLQEARRMREQGLTADEFHRAKEQLKGSYMLGQESTSARSSAIGRSMLMRGYALEEGEMLSRIAGVRMEDVEGILPYVLDETRMVAAVVGRQAVHEPIRQALNM